MNNIQLYKKIMSSISREVKRALNESERRISKDEWRRILQTMIQYNRSGGYVDDVDGKLTFFDSDPCINGVKAFYVTINDVRDIINGTYMS